MVTVYSYVLDTLADWELGYVTSELNSGRFLKKASNAYRLRWLVILPKPFIQWGTCNRAKLSN
ncbi:MULTISPECIES: hypothetical protein [Carnobacterium]|uniref:hypothetical protein n=1 Tax=Carnobacterium TaxID=2747 RepID=UPI002892A356|nr:MULTISPECIES: hypothetical protein [Carnobacterium]MDV8935295.1 hypothetical protein [Carnobacterium sp.]